MNEWREITFSEAVNVNPMRVLSRDSIAPYIEMSEVAEFQRKVKAIVPRKYKGSGARFQNGDTLLARITPCLENGKTAFVSELRDEEVGWGSTEFVVLNGKPGVTDDLFVYYLAISPEVRAHAIQNMTGTSGRQRVSPVAFDRLVVPIPPLTIQHRIAEILGRLDDKIEVNRRINRTLEAMAQALYRYWFVDFANPSGLGDPKGFGDEFVESAVGLVPRGWEVKALDEIATYTNGLALQKYPPKGDAYLPVIKIAEMRRGVTESSDKASPDIDARYIVQDGDVLFSWSGTLLVTLWCGGPGALNQHLFKVTSAQYPKWLYYWATKHHLDEFKQIAANKVTTMGHIQRHHLAEALVAIPPAQEFKRIDRTMSLLLDKIIECELESRQLAATRDYLLPRLLAGEVEV